MKRQMKLFGILAAGILVFLAACGGGAEVSPTADPGAFYTQAVETAYAQLTQTALAMPAATTEVVLNPEATATQGGPTNTPLPTGLPSATLGNGLTPTPLATRVVGTQQPTQQTCDNFLLLQDVTIPDGSIMNPGENFDKVWEIQNLGPCNWTTQYRLVWAYGDWYGTPPTYLYYDVPAGDTIQVWVNLTAPTTPGQFFAAFVMQNDRGTNFGITSPLTVVIKVEATPTP